MIDSFEPLALVGMDAAWAGCDGLIACERLLYEMGAGAAVSAEQAAKVPAGRIDRVAQGARQDAGLQSSHRVAVLTAGPAPLRLDAPWAAHQSDLSDRANPLASALEMAQSLLSSGEADAVLFAACSGLMDVPEKSLLSANDAAGFGFDREARGWHLGDGAAALVWMTAQRARREGLRVYAEIRSAAWVDGKNPGVSAARLPEAPALDAVRSCCRSALEAARVTPDQVGYIEAFAAGVDALDGIEIAGLVQTYRQPAQELTTALGSLQANTGYLGAAAGLAGMLRAALCLSLREIPGAPGWTAPKLPALWRGAPFYVPTESRAWFQPRAAYPRLAALNVLGGGGSFMHVILSEPPAAESGARGPSDRLTRALDSGGFYLFPLPAASLEDLLASLAILQQSLAGSTDLNALAAETFRAASARADAPYALAVVGHDAAELAREIEFAQKALPGAWESGAEWQTPLGSCFTPHPVGRTGGVALVYPGAFNSYPMVGKDLFRLFPGLFDAMDAVTGDLGGVIHERLLYPRSLAAISKDELAALETKLLADPIAMLVSGTTLAILYTHILQTAFKIRASAAFGYSLGENSMLYATGVWGQGDDAAARIKASETFQARLAGPQLAVREHWGMKYPNGGSGEPLWSNYLVMAAPDKVLPALEKEPRVYLTHINAPRQVVIGGDPQGCQRVLAELRASSIQAPFDYALHCEAMRSESGALAELHDWPVEQDPGLRMYTAAGYGPLHLEQAEIARRMAEMLVSPLDFPRLVNRVYDDGARVFIEAGAGGNCARWVSESLKGRPHLSLSLNRRGSDDYSTLVRTLARLSSHRVPLDLSPLYALNGVTSMNSMDEKAL